MTTRQSPGASRRDGSAADWGDVRLPLPPPGSKKARAVLPSDGRRKGLPIVTPDLQRYAAGPMK